MKNIKKLLSIVMVLTLVLALGAQAFAAQVNITATADGVVHQYTAYKIFSGTQAEGSEKLASIEWGDGIDETAFLKALAAKYPDNFSEGMTAEAAAGAMSAEGVDAAEVAKIAATCTEGAGQVLSAGNNVLDDGYYLIKDTTPADQLNGSAAYNDVMLQATGTIDITWKSDVPKSEKNVKDINDSTDKEAGAWGKSADWDIGDDVPFQLKGTLPSNYGDYDKYYIAFHDTDEEGLELNQDSITVTVVNADGTTVATLGKDQYTVNVPGNACEDGCTFEVVISDLKTAAAAAAAGYCVVVEYTARLTEDAVIGNPGNPNTMYMEFSNNPNGEQYGNTTPEKVIVFTYDMDVNKVDPEGNKLTGAEFKLYKEVPEGTEGANHLTKEGEVATAETKDDDLLEDDEGNVHWYIASPNDLAVDGTGSTFTAEGLDDGNYVIVETKAPDGYNKAAPIPFTLSATHDKTTTVTSPTGDFTIEMNPADEEAIIDTDVVNKSGLELPETGGIGTTIFYVVGGILVAAAVILLVTRRRVSEK